MNPSRQFIARPIATSLFMLAILLAGLLAYRLLPQAALPQVDYPTIQVTTLYPGASPELMTRLVTSPLERQFGAIAGLKQMSSNSSGGASIITLQFELGLRLDVAEQSVQAAINTAANFLPRDLPTPPIYSKVNPADLPILTLAVTAEGIPPTEVQDWVDTFLSQKIAQVNGVGLVSLSGGQRPAVRIKVNPQALAAYGVGLDQVRSAIINANSNQAKGNFESELQAFAIDANSQLKSPEEYAALALTSNRGALLRLGDVAEVSNGAENTQLAAWANQQPAILVSVQRQPGANVIEVTDSIQALLPQLQAALPDNIHIHLLSDRTITVRAALAGVKFELSLAIALVVMVIFLFLRSVSATLIPSLAVPLSLIGTFGIMYLAGFSLNNLTLMALTIATGFVVDDAIVMIENIARHIEEGEKPLAAALKGSEQIGFTIISLTFSLIAVLIPLLFMGDVVGRLFREFAITLAVAILISAVVSLTLTPMLCARLLKPGQHHQGRFAQWTEAWLDRVIARYKIGLMWVLERQRQTSLVVAGTIFTSVLLAILVPKGFFPQQDTGVIQGISEGPQDISFTAMSQRQLQLSKILEADPAVESISSVVGIDGINSTLNSGRLLINLKPFAERESLDIILPRLQQLSQQVEGIRLFLQPAQDLTLDDRISRTQYQYLIESTDPQQIDRWLPQLLEKLQSLAELEDVTSNLQNQGLSAFVEVDRDMAARLGVSLASVDDALYNAFGQRLVSTIFTQSNQYRVVLEVAQEEESGLKALDSLYVSSRDGRQIPLSSLARWSEKPTHLLISREKQFPAATISFNLREGVSLGEAVKKIESAQAELALPASVQTRFQGAALVFRSALNNQLWLIIAALVTMYIVLGVLYESYIHPLTILSTLPSAGIGALLALLVMGRDLSVIAIIGIILLIGIVQKNAIMIIDFALDAQRNQGLNARDAVVQASLLRFRPILMTTLAALFSAVPLVLGEGAGSELRQPLGITLIGGLLVSQMLTLFTTPVVYLAFDRFVKKETIEQANTQVLL